MAHLGYVVVERLLGGRLRELYRADPFPVGAGPRASPLAFGAKLVPNAAVRYEQMGEAVLRAREVRAYVLKDPR